jgi:hypothetical protein
MGVMIASFYGDGQLVRQPVDRIEQLTEDTGLDTDQSAADR